MTNVNETLEEALYCLPCLQVSRTREVCKRYRDLIEAKDELWVPKQVTLGMLQNFKEVGIPRPIAALLACVLSKYVFYVPLSDPSFIIAKGTETAAVQVVRTYRIVPKYDRSAYGSGGSALRVGSASTRYSPTLSRPNYDGFTNRKTRCFRFRILTSTISHAT